MGKSRHFYVTVDGERALYRQEGQRVFEVDTSGKETVEHEVEWDRKSSTYVRKEQTEEGEVNMGIRISGVANPIKVNQNAKQAPAGTDA